MRLSIVCLLISCYALAKGQMPQRVNDPRMEYQVGFRPFGSDRPCYSLINETLIKNDDDIIIERILMNLDDSGTSGTSFNFNSNSNSNSNSNRVDNMASRICSQMQNTVGYLKNICQQDSANVDQTSQAKLRTLSSLREYLCLNGATNLKEMIASNGGQCVRRIRDVAESNCNLPQHLSGTGTFNSGSFHSGNSNSGSSSNFGGNTAGNINPNRIMGKSLSELIISSQSYNSESCRLLTDAANCVSDRYNRAVEICYPQFTMHMSKIIALLVQNTCGVSLGSFPNNNNNNNNFNNFNSNNNNQNQNNPPNFNTQSSNNFPLVSNSNLPQNDKDYNQRPTTFNPSPVWMTTRRPGNSATIQTISTILLSVVLIPCLIA